jgi:hypothetical protein
MKDVVARAMPADDLTRVVNCIRCFESIWFARLTQAKILNRIVRKQHRPMVLIAALAVTDHLSPVVDTEGFAGGATIQRTQRRNRRVS